VPDVHFDNTDVGHSASFTNMCCSTIVVVICCIHDVFMSLQIRGHCVADLDPLDITQARHAETEEEARSKFLATYRYHTIYNIGKVAQQTVEVVRATAIIWLMP